jgi:hypothetical protein
MLFEGHGVLLRAAANLLRDDVASQVDDPDLRAAVLSVAQLVGETSIAWPGLFSLLDGQNEILADLVEADPQHAAAGAADPFRRHAALVRQVRARILDLNAGDADSRGDLVRIRSGLRAMAEVEQQLLRHARHEWGLGGELVTEPITDYEGDLT